jgi:segregation and condensation protein B
MQTEARRAIEAILMVSDSPIEPQLLAQITEIPVAQVEAICSELASDYEATERGFVIQRVAGGYRFQSHPDMAPYVERFVLDGQSARMSAAALETLAIVAYKQPISRAQIASIRGVNVDGVIRTLQSRGYVDEVSRDPGPGNAIMYGTTRAFLEKLGLDSVDQLPPLGAFVPGADVVEQLERTLRVDQLDALTTDEVAASNGAHTSHDDDDHDMVSDDDTVSEHDDVTAADGPPPDEG